MAVHERAGQPAEAGQLVDLAALLDAYTARTPDPEDPAQRVAFGTSGHRGSSLRGSFNEAHILATTQAICDRRRADGIDGPLYLARDTHALSAPAFHTAVEVLAANGVAIRVDAADGYTPTPALSHAILVHNRRGGGGTADGIVITPSHNPPEDGGFKYDPPHGGPADGALTKAIEDAANGYLRAGLAGVRRMPWGRAIATAGRHDYLGAYVADLGSVIDMEAIAASGLRIGVDPLGGAAVAYWGAIAERYGLDLTVTNTRVDPRFAFMTCDWDGRIRMDPSSRYAMAGLVALRARFDLALGNDADADRHGIVTPAAGLLDPNHVLAVMIDHLFGGARSWGPDVAVGKTLVSSALIDRVVAGRGRRLLEVPVGFKWFVDGLLDGTLGFGGEESAGASFLRRDGTTWTTDKDGIAACLLAAEVTAVTGEDPGVRYAGLAARYGAPVYRRVDAPATRAQKAALAALTPAQVPARTLGGDPITAILVAAPGNGAAIGGLKIVTEHGWAAVRPSGTEDVAKVYAESFRGEEHLARIIEEAQALVRSAAG